MSASSKKKLRREQEATALTERQLTEQAEAKKLRNLTIVFVTAIALVVLITAGVLVSRAITKSGIREKGTVAVTLDGEKLNSAELNYYYIDAINNFYEPIYSSYTEQAPAYALMLYGIDVTSPLDEQVKDKETGATWADHFIDQAILNAKGAYALYNAAMEAGFEMDEETAKSIDTVIANTEMMAAIYGYASVNDYLHSMYGYGTNVDSYREYYRVNTIAYAYQTAHAESLVYDDAAIREKEAENFHAYSSFNYDIITVYTSSFLGEGEKDENGTITFTDEQRAEAVKKAEEIANSLIDGATSTADVDAAIKALADGEEVSNLAAETTKYTDRLYANIAADVAEWLAADGRKDNDMAVIPYTTTSTDDEGNENESVTGYYVVIFHSINENKMTLPTVRHLLVAFEGGTTDETTGKKTYSAEEIAKAKEEAETLLKQWEDGDMTEDSFAALANEKSDDNVTNAPGGLYEGIIPGQMVPEFEAWCFDANHKTGDYGLVQTEYGWHIMYFVDAGTETYRDYMISYDMKNLEMNEWYTALVDAVKVEEGSFSRLNTALVISK